MRNLDLSSWLGVATSLLGLALLAVIGVGFRVLMMLTVQQRQQRMNRQINERLKTLISAYKTLGGSFTGALTVDPRHLRDVQAAEADEQAQQSAGEYSDRPRRIRDAVEGALSDILLLGTEEHVRLAGQAARDMAAGRPIHTAELVIALRSYIRAALDLDPIPASVNIPLQGPTRPQPGGGRGGKGGSERARDGGGSGQGGGGGGMGGGGMGGGGGFGADTQDDDR